MVWSALKYLPIEPLCHSYVILQQTDSLFHKYLRRQVSQHFKERFYALCADRAPTCHSSQKEKNLSVLK